MRLRCCIKFLWILVRLLATFFSFQEGQRGTHDSEYTCIQSSVSDMSDLFGMSHSAECDVETAVELKPGAAVHEHVIQVIQGVGSSFSEQRVLNRGRKGFRAFQRDITHHQSFYHLQHRYTRCLSWPVIVVAIGILVALSVFRGFYYPSTRGIASTANPTIRISNLQDAAIDSRLAGEFRPQLSGFAKNNHNRAARAGMVFRRKVLDTLQGMLWGAQLNKLTEAEVGDVPGKSEIPPSNIVELRDEGLVYRNFTHFTKTYAEMKKKLKIYVYKEGYKPLVHGAKTGGIYATEGLFLKRMEDPGNIFTVSDPKEAHMFFLPYSVRQLVDFVQDPYSRSMRPMKTFISNYIQTIASKYPYWNRTRGSDHFFLSCHDWAPHSTMLNEDLHKNAMKVVCNADLKANFDALKDVSIPQTLKGGNQSDSETGSLPPDERDFLAFYAGQMHGLVRPVLTRHWKDKDPSMKVYEVLPPEIASNISYADHMKRSKYCLCPKGFEVNSPRIVEAILSGCVPVIVADNFVLPFRDVLDWTKFSIVVAEKDIPHLKIILTSIPDDTYRSMQSRLRLVKRHFLWLEDPQDTQYDSFHMILYSIWRQSVKIRKRKSEAD